MSPIKAESCLESWNCHLFLFFHVWKKVSRQAKNGISQEDRGKLNEAFPFPTCQFQLAETLPISVFGRKNADTPKNIPMHQVPTSFLMILLHYVQVTNELWKNTFLGLVKSVWCSPCQNWNCQLPLGTTKRFKTRKTCVWCPIKCSWQKCFYR